MLQIGGRDVVYSKSFTIRANEEAVITAPELEGAILCFRAEQIADGVTPGLSDMRREVNGNTIKFIFPFIQESNLSSELTSIGVGRMPGASVRFVAQGGMSLMTIQVDVFWTPDRF